ncbi:ribosome recycling factor [Microbacter margulisiae]|uniref:Ribosome-recycling factor n=1 Tax=Microbacter margulisiae TaxID=1350067 RepID=A0A7W5DPI0_9PORP|nr:ribosome recycling factor [Microbacter margulisiae]MBB3186702.1 ribosome recycling factor [Microbacter margulisiae]
MTDVKQVLKSAETKMAASISFLDETFAHIRAGKANPRILDGLHVEYYGNHVPISAVATITTPDAKTITIQPWEKAMISVIEKVIMASEIGITPINNGEVIRLSIPIVTEERRKQLVKQAKHEAEEAKVSIRTARRDAIDLVKRATKDGMPEDEVKDAENEAQKIHDKFIKKVDEMLLAKEKEIMTI